MWTMIIYLHEVKLGICGTLRSFSLGNSGPIRQEVKTDPAQNDPFPEADLAGIIMNRFCDCADVCNFDQELVGDPIPPPRRHPTINTSGKRIEVEVE
jgi:hypothetical protein